jgi:hypothetical protein
MDKEAPQLKAFSISTEQKQTLTEPCQPRGPKPKYLPAIQKVLEEQKGELTDRQIFYRLVSVLMAQYLGIESLTAANPYTKWMNVAAGHTKIILNTIQTVMKQQKKR